jgi:hypothetical protein
MFGGKPAPLGGVRPFGTGRFDVAALPAVAVGVTFSGLVKGCSQQAQAFRGELVV